MFPIPAILGSVALEVLVPQEEWSSLGHNNDSVELDIETAT